MLLCNSPSLYSSTGILKHHGSSNGPAQRSRAGCNETIRLEQIAQIISKHGGLGQLDVHRHRHFRDSDSFLSSDGINSATMPMISILKAPKSSRPEKYN